MFVAYSEPIEITLIFSCTDSILNAAVSIHQLIYSYVLKDFTGLKKDVLKKFLFQFSKFLIFMIAVNLILSLHYH